MVGVGDIIGGKFRVDAVLGAGGMGIVVAASHLELGHRVAIKFLRDEMLQNHTVVERFLREARSVVNLKTEHVCRVTDVGRFDTGAPYIVMELLEGADLARVVATKPLPITTAVEYILQALVALAEAHTAGIVHRDLKPANLFVTRRLDGGPLVKVLDFGIAKAMAETGAQLTLGQGAMGSPGFMSPEQLQSPRDVDLRTDIWAIGATLYQLLSARMPYPAPTLTEIAIRIASEPPDPLDVPPELRSIIFRCLDKTPDQRYPDVAALAAALVPFGGPSARRIATTVGQLANRPLLLPPIPATPSQVRRDAPTAVSMIADTDPQPRRNGRTWLVVLAVLLAAGAGALAVVLATRTTTPHADAGVVAIPVSRDASPPAADAATVAKATDNVASDPEVAAAAAEELLDETLAGQIDDALAGDVPGVGTAPAGDAGARGRAPNADFGNAKTKAVATAQMKQMQDLAKEAERNGMEMLKLQCAQMQKPEFAQLMRSHGQDPAQIQGVCACITGDAAAARAIFATMTKPNDKRSMMSTCKQKGISLP